MSGSELPEDWVLPCASVYEDCSGPKFPMSAYILVLTYLDIIGREAEGDVLGIGNQLQSCWVKVPWEKISGFSTILYNLTNSKPQWIKELLTSVQELGPSCALRSLTVKDQTFVFLPSGQTGHSLLARPAGTCPGEHWSSQAGFSRLQRARGQAYLFS